MPQSLAETAFDQLLLTALAFRGRTGVRNIVTEKGKSMANSTSFFGVIRGFFRDYLTVMGTRGSFGLLVQRATEDAALRQRLLTAPQKTLAEAGVTLPAGIDIEIVENTDNKIVAVLPGPQSAELRDRTKDIADGPVANVPAGLTLEWQGSALIATGRIDTNAAPALRRELMRAFMDVDLVMSGVTFLSSPGLAALLAGQKHLNIHDWGYGCSSGRATQRTISTSACPPPSRAPRRNWVSNSIAGQWPISPVSTTPAAC
jgi:hypothetical protein